MYGLLDSHTVLSTMSSLRLDNLVYTVEGGEAGSAPLAEYLVEECEYYV